MKLYIDNQEVELDRNAGVSISLSIASVTQLESGRTGYSKTIRVPMTPKNREVLGDVAEVHAQTVFNQQLHTARIEVEGCVVIEGVPMMSRCETSLHGQGWYYLNIIGAGKEWVKRASEQMLRAVELPFEANLNPVTVSQSWSWEKPVRFFPVLRDTFSIDSSTLQSGVRMLTFEDYHPFIQVKALMEAIAAQGGYVVESEFMNTPFFESLYMSGRYPEQEVEIYEVRNGFLAKRFAEKQAVANRLGRVYADPYTTLSSVGNFVDTADPQQVQGEGGLEGVYNQNECFRNEEGGVVYRPVESVIVGFEYKVRYKSEYKIATRDRLCCFDRLYLDDDLERTYRVTNRYPDRKESLQTGFGYRLFVFDHQAGDQYKITYDQELPSGETVQVEVKTFNSRTVELSIASGIQASNLQVWMKDQDGAYLLYEGDWALYDGYVTETGEIDIEITARSAARRVLPSEGRRFDALYFGGAQEGMKFTISDQVTLRPIFMPHPCEGMDVTIAEVAAHEIRQIDFVNAIKQLFNLYFYSDQQAKILYVEPRDQFYRESPIVDWSDKMDRELPVVIEELGYDLSQEFTLRYQPGDGASARWDELHKTVLGRWSTPVLNRFAKEGEKIYYNPLFTPSINQTALYPDAPAASLILAGDRDRKGNAVVTDNLNFPPKIVRFVGVETLPEQQWWGWPTYGKNYPRIGFHDPDTGYSLAFEDRDQQTGLHRYFDKTLEVYNQGRRITLYLDLRPEDIEPFIIPNGLCRDFRALFQLKIGGEKVLCRLEEICDYNPLRKGSTKCIFLKA